MECDSGHDDYSYYHEWDIAVDEMNLCLAHSLQIIANALLYSTICSTARSKSLKYERNAFPMGIPSVMRR